jgi:16S rRNA (cytosine967-C5)-methyltransferase
MTTTEDRLAAARAVGRVLRSGAWSNVVARAEARTADADLAVVQGLTFAVLRHGPLVDQTIAESAGRDLGRIDKGVLDVLRVATAEIVADRTPAPLVVDGAVHAVRRLSPRAVGFANAVLRRVSERAPHAQTLSDIGMPEFVDTALRHVMEPDDVDAFWRASQEPAPVGLRSTQTVEGAEPVPGISGAWVWSGGELPEGIAIQDPASVAVGNLVAAPAGGTVLDVAAAPGGKAAHLVEQVGPEGVVIAMDMHARRVLDASRRVSRARWLIGDGCAPPFLESSFDAILVDAPCTGLGTLRRRPELRMRVTPEEMARLAVIQRQMLEQALRLVRPGGRVVYSVCTVTPAETIDVVAGLGSVVPAGLPGHAFGEGWLMAPHLGPTDGMFVAAFDR